MFNISSGLGPEFLRRLFGFFKDFSLGLIALLDIFLNNPVGLFLECGELLIISGQLLFGFRFLGFQLGQAVGQLERLARLDEDRLPAVRAIVHQAGNASPAARLDRQDAPTAAAVHPHVGEERTQGRGAGQADLAGDRTPVPESETSRAGAVDRIADVDVDGDLDLFVCNYVRWSRDVDLELVEEKELTS